MSIESAVTSKKESVTSAKRKYILDLQVSKLRPFGSAMAGRDGRQLKSSKCLVYQGANNAF